MMATKTKSIYEYNNYKHFIRELIKSFPSAGRGQKKALSEAIGCQMTYITHVLSGQSHFSLEQSVAASRHFELNPQETEYFIFLVQENRSATTDLREFFAHQLKRLREKHETLRERLKITESVPALDQAVYYSSWKYSAVHMALTVPGFQTMETLSKRFNIPHPQLLNILDFLCKKGLAQKEGSLFKAKKYQLFLDMDSPLISKLHTNWRLRALDALDAAQETNLHFSSVFSVSRSDLPKIREHLLKAIEDSTNIIRPSKDEDVAVLCTDLFYA